MVASFDLLVLRATDPTQSARFYEALGCTFIAERHGNGPEHFAAVIGGVVFEIYPLGKQPTTAGVRLGFQVSSVSEALAAALAAGGTLQTPPAESPWGLRAVLRDPDGHTVEIKQLA